VEAVGAVVDEAVDIAWVQEEMDVEEGGVCPAVMVLVEGMVT